MGSTGRGDIEEKLAQARQILMKIPGVTSVAWGYKEKTGRLTQELCFIVMVRRKKPPETLSEAEQVPRELLGIPTDVIPAPRLRDLQCENFEKFDTLVGGIMISKLKVFQATGSVTGEGVGTLGFFATNNTSSSRDNVVLLTNNHILASDGGAVRDVIYQPRFTGGAGSFHLDRNDMHPIGTIENMGLRGNRDFAYPGEASQSMYVDCGTAHVNTSFSSCCHTNCGTKFANILHNLSLAQGLSSSEVAGVARVTNADLPSGGDYVVYKVGHRTGWTRGKLRTALASNVDPDDASIHQDRFMIIDDLGPNCGGGAHFADSGDSGAVILNAQRQIIGLLFSDSDTGFFAACHIHPVLDLLGITMVSTQNTAGASGGATSLEMALSLDESEHDVPRAMALREQVLNSERGRAYRALVEKHLNEVVHLVNRVRPVTVAWHRLNGPDFLGHVLHASRHAAYAVPRELKGQGRDDALAKMLETLSRHGSFGLRADIERYSDEVRDMAREIDDIESLATQLHLPQMSMK
jgi:hypothetical protein